MLVFVLTLLLVSVSGQTDPDLSAPLTDASTALALKLYRAVAALDPDENAVLCPLGMIQMLAQVQLGARGSTLQQLRRAMHPADVQNGEEKCS